MHKSDNFIFQLSSNKQNLKYAIECLQIKTANNSKFQKHLESIPKNLACIENVLLPKSHYSSQAPSFISLESRKHILTEIAVGISQRKTIFLIGPFGSGKTKFVEYLTKITGHKELVDFQRIAMNDQIDGKTLIGSYSCQEVPGM